jgi:hypothetical protein
VQGRSRPAVGAARFIGENDALGSIERGKLADFVVLGADYLTVRDAELSKIPIVNDRDGWSDRVRDGAVTAWILTSGPGAHDGPVAVCRKLPQVAVAARLPACGE